MDINYKKWAYLTLMVVAIVIFSDSLQAITSNEMKGAFKAAKTDIWAWMHVVKLGSAVMGIVMSVVQHSLMPLGIGVGLSAGIQVFDTMLGDGAAALIF
jgi:hypothetical protein